MEKLTDVEVQRCFGGLQGWSLRGETLYKEFTFSDFDAAWAWMSSVAQVAQTLNHHPDWSNVYNRVTVTLTTHDADGLTELDFELAREMDARL
jgi:4a-hydroxytetrahydrobiopterin dehydratase